jgi:DNA-binding NarL/FixJ family response regulator
VIRVGIVDDHPVFRLGLVRSFEREPDLTVAWEVGTADEVFQILPSKPVDVVLMDLYLGPGQDGLAATQAIRKSYADVKVIIISASLDWETASASRIAGACGYLPKDLAVADMVAAIRGLASPKLGTMEFNLLLAPPAGTNPNTWVSRQGLTKREQEVLGELRRGRTNREIANRLNVSITTVNKHVQQVLKKLSVRTRAQAVARVYAEMSGSRYTTTGR